LASISYHSGRTSHNRRCRSHQCGVDAATFGLPVPLRRQCHCLHLHGVDPRQAADAF
jgi:hypothetical protein